MEYHCHVWAGTASWYLEWIWRTGGCSLVASLEPLAQHRNLSSLNLFYGYYFGRCSSELAALVLLPYS